MRTLSEEQYDTRFSLPAVDDPAAVEVGVILLGLDAERLLAGLGVATLGDDPAVATQVVDQLRHGLPALESLRTVVDGGAARWRSARPALAAAQPDGPVSAAVRRAWAQVLHTVDTAGLGELGPAGRAYLAACWLRRSEVDDYLEAHHAVPPLPA
jgi:hypothetical protein